MLKGYSLRFFMDNCTTVGPPLSPPFNFTQESIVGNIIEHNLDWSSPFTWSDFPITNYTSIDVHNHLSGDSITITKSLMTQLTLTSQTGEAVMSWISHWLPSTELVKVSQFLSVLVTQ